MTSYRAWQMIGGIFLAVGLAELLLRGLLEDSRAGLAIGVVCLITAASSFGEARSQKRNAEARLDQIRQSS